MLQQVEDLIARVIGERPIAIEGYKPRWTTIELVMPRVLKFGDISVVFAHAGAIISSNGTARFHVKVDSAAHADETRRERAGSSMHFNWALPASGSVSMEFGNRAGKVGFLNLLELAFQIVLYRLGLGPFPIFLYNCEQFGGVWLMTASLPKFKTLVEFGRRCPDVSEVGVVAVIECLLAPRLLGMLDVLNNPGISGLVALRRGAICDFSPPKWSWIGTLERRRLAVDFAPKAKSFASFFVGLSHGTLTSTLLDRIGPFRGYGKGRDELSAILGHVDHVEARPALVGAWNSLVARAESLRVRSFEPRFVSVSSPSLSMGELIGGRPALLPALSPPRAG